MKMQTTKGKLIFKLKCGVHSMKRWKIKTPREHWFLNLMLSAFHEEELKVQRTRAFCGTARHQKALFPI